MFNVSFDSLKLIVPAIFQVVETALCPTPDKIDLITDGVFGVKIFASTAQKVVETYSNTKEMLALAYEGHVRAHRRVGQKIAHAQRTYQTFSEGELGKWALLNARLFVGEVCGSQVGYMFPEAAISYSLGSKAARSVLPASPRGFFKAQAVGAVCFITTAAVAPFFGETGLLVSSLGSIAGGHEGRELLRVKEWSNDSKGILDTYPAKKVQAMAAQSFVYVVRSVVPHQGEIATKLIGHSFHYIAGFAGYNGLDIYQMMTATFNNDSSIQNLDPAHLLKMIVRKTYGTTECFVEQLSIDENGISQIPSQLQEHLAQLLENETGARTLVRTLNQFSRMIQNPQFQNSLQLMPQFPGLKETLQTHLKSEVEKSFHWSDQALLKPLSFVVTDQQISKIITLFLRQIKKLELRKTGFVLSDLKKNKILLEVLAAGFMPLLLKNLIWCALRSPTELTQELTQNEIRDFYSNLQKMIHTSYEQYEPFRFVSSIGKDSIPHLLQSSRLVPKALENGLNSALTKAPIREVTKKHWLDPFFRGVGYLIQAVKVAFLAIAAYFVGRKVAPQLSRIPLPSKEILQGSSIQLLTDLHLL